MLKTIAYFFDNLTSSFKKVQGINKSVQRQKREIGIRLSPVFIVCGLWKPSTGGISQGEIQLFRQSKDFRRSSNPSCRKRRFRVRRCFRIVIGKTVEIGIRLSPFFIAVDLCNPSQ